MARPDWTFWFSLSAILLFLFRTLLSPDRHGACVYAPALLPRM
jgi:hypothetical protein